MQFGDIGLDDIAKFGALCVGATAAAFVIKATGYFTVVGPEFIGLYLDGNILTGIFYAAPYVFSVVSLSIWIYYWIYRGFRRLFDDETEITRMLLFYDKVMIIPITIAVLFANGKWVFIEEIVFAVAAFIVGGVVFFQYFHFERINYINVIFCAFAIYSAVYVSGKADAVSDLLKKEPVFDIYTTDTNYVNAIILKTASNGIVIRWGDKIIFYKTDDIKKISRHLDAL